MGKTSLKVTIEQFKEIHEKATEDLKVKGCIIIYQNLVIDILLTPPV